MEIKTITCHEVYNHGASLQEHALLKFLDNKGHKTETINYQPNYLNNHFNFWRISNPRYKKNLLFKVIYLILKFPSRYKLLKRKRAFDEFSKKYIKSTNIIYKTNSDLKNNLPMADSYICGSDQIWNSFFENGKDPAFYLDFVPNDKLKISYAASFAIDKIDDSLKEFVRQKVSRLNYISVRESSGIKILEDLGINRAIQVLDPVFLLESKYWDTISVKKLENDYIFVYDCDSDPMILTFIEKLKKKSNYKIVTVNKNIKYADKYYDLCGPDVFLSLIKNADFVVSNSFHAVAFSIIFKKQFTVFNRFEKINTRMKDIVNLLEISEVLIENKNQVNNFNYIINYDKMNSPLSALINHSRNYLENALIN
ncbi:MAG: polysaccharide pyruvyl transferase family protein [Flavobacteriaceae bacterium]|nr:polysaccharide pyruvyl transferase family protein [Flavobacteriaceae bacterium]